MAENVDNGIKIRGTPLRTTLGAYLDKTIALEIDAAAEAYIPGYPASPLSNAGPIPTDQAGDANADKALAPGEGVQDLRDGSLKSLNEYAQSLVEASSNENQPQESAAFSPPMRRGTSIEPRFDQSDFIWAGADERTDHLGDNLIPAVSNFWTLSGGQQAGTLGSFFGSGRLAELLSKTGEVGEPSANYLLKDNASKIGEKVEAVLDETNMFSPKQDGSPYLKTDVNGLIDAGVGSEEEAYTKGLWSVQTGRGRGVAGVPLGFDENAPAVTTDVLREMVLQVMLRATGESVAAGSISMGGTPDVLQESIIEGIAQATDIIDGFNAIQVGFDKQNMAALRIAAIATAIDESTPKGKAIKRLVDSVGAESFLRAAAARSGYTGFPRGEAANDESYGNMNSWAEPFGGIMPVGMLNSVLVGLLAVLAIGILIDIVGSMLPAMGDRQDAVLEPSEPSTLALGINQTKTSSDTLMDQLFRAMGLPSLKSGVNFGKAFNLGVRAYYGLPTSIGGSISIGDILEFAINLGMAPSFYLIQMRLILRDLNVIGAAASKIADAMMNALFVSPMTTASALFGAFHMLLSSYTFKFAMLCAGVGDKVFDADNQPGRVSGGSIPIGEEHLRTILTPRNRMWLGRFYTPEPGSSAVSPLSLALQSSILLAPPTTFGGGSFSYDTPRHRDELVARKEPLDPNRGTVATSVWGAESGRIGTETVKNYEAVLDLEYTPFYVHDLRTNEIISMPAFISSVGESYAPEWSETHGYGRTDPVRTYAKTTRSIDLSFKLVAMNPADMNFMWVVINKLVAMCYPQRSMGRVRTMNLPEGPSTFVQPFSQVPTASPVIRLRLGELLHSNYSLPGLQRLFGHPGAFNVNATAEQQTPQYWTDRKRASLIKRATAEVKDEIQERFYEAAGNAYTAVKYTASQGTKISLDTAPSGRSGPLAAAASLLTGPPDMQAYVPTTLGGGVRYKILDANPWVGKAPAGANGPALSFYKIELDFVTAQRAKDALGDKFDIVFPDGAPKRGAKANAWLDVASAKKTSFHVWSFDPELQSMIEQRMVDLDATVQGEIDQQQSALLESGFFTAENNAIVRSFAAAGGAGLAGVITSMALNYDGATWGTDPDKKDRAPQQVEITIGFAPIHDLPLGLDHNGAMIAPSHPVGTLNPRFGETMEPGAESSPGVDLASRGPGLPPDPAAEPGGILGAIAGAF